jgi:hypothetical protein
MKTRTSIRFILLGLLLTALGFGLKLVQQFTQPERLTEMARRELESALQKEAELESVQHAGGGAFVVSGVAITSPGAAEPAVEIPRALVALDLPQILSRRFVPRTVTVVDPVVRLSYDRNERRWNIEDLFPERPAPPARPTKRLTAVGLLADGIAVDNATLIVANEGLFGDDEPRKLTGINARILPFDPSRNRWTFEARVTDGPFAGAHLTGWVSGGADPDFGIDFDARSMETTEALWNVTPYWHRAPEGLRVAGRLDCSGSIRLDENRKLRVNLNVDVSDGDVETPYYPVGVTDAAGGVTITENRISIRNVTGRVPDSELGVALTGGRAPHARVNGSVSLRRGISHIAVEATDLPICRRTIEGIPSAGADVWRRLRPDGVGRLALSLTMQPHQRTRFVADLTVRGATMHPREVPAPVQDVTGRIVVSDAGVRLDGLTGMVAQAGAAAPDGVGLAAFRADGFVDFDERVDAMRVAISNLATDEEMVRAIPRVGDDLWRLFRPQVCADAEVMIQDGESASDRSVSILVAIHGGRAEPEFLGMPLTEAAGTLRVESGKVFIEQFSGVLHTEGEESSDIRARSVFTVRGTLDPAARHADIDLAASDLMLNEQVLAAIPGIGPRLWEEVHPVGVAALSGKVAYRGDEEPLRFFLDMDLRDVAVLAKALPVPIDAMSGQLLITEKRLVSNRVSGVSCGGSFDSALSVYYGPDAVLPRFAGTVSFSGVDLGHFVEKFTRKKTDLQGRVAGTLDLGGELGDQSTVAGKGHIALEEGYLWSRPLFASILSVLHLTLPKGADVPAQGTASFDIAADIISVRSFDLTGGGLSLSGRGTVGMDGSLDLTMVAVGAPEESGGIPIVTPFVNWVMRIAERELVKLDVTGTLEEPRINSTLLSKITWPLTNLRSILIDPLLGTGDEG